MTARKITNRQKWLRTICWLRREFPAQHDVTIRTVHLSEGHHGDINFHTLFFWIRINKKKVFDQRIETLLHEWAHAVTWFGSDQEEPHSDEWGLAYAKIYRKHDEWDYGRAETTDASAPS